MRLAIISITSKGAELASRLDIELNKTHRAERFAYVKNYAGGAESFDNLSHLVSEIFHEYDGLIFVCACGIAVRSLAKNIQSKQSDPAVVVLDDNGKFAISLLSGHLGRANALTKVVSDIIGALPVITTATDVGGIFSPDSFALANHLHICSISMAKSIAAEVLKGSKIGLVSDYECVDIPNEFAINNQCQFGLCISKDVNKKPFEHTLNLIPKDIIIGAGCRKNLASDIFEKFILERLSEINIPIESVRILATIDVKKNEKAMLDFCRKHKLEFMTFSSDELMNQSGDFDISEFVMKNVGVDNVCERSAVAAGGRLICKKKAGGGATFAAAVIDDIDIDFGRVCL